MPWQDPTETLVAVGGEINVAPVGTTLPTTTTGALDPAFIGLGYTTEDGVSYSVGKETSDVNAWQEFDPIKTIITARTIQASFTLMQWNEATIPLAFGGGSVSGSAPNFKYEPPDPSEGIDERAVVIDANSSDDDHVRIIFPRVTIVDAVETNFRRNEPAGLPITVRALAPADGVSKIFTIYSDAAGFTAGS